MSKRLPEIGRWYQDAVEDVLFEVVAVDENTSTVEVQYEGGELSEFDLETWKQMVLLPAEAPEDWRSSYELSSDDTDPDAILIPDNFGDPLSSLDDDNSWRDLEDYS